MAWVRIEDTFCEHPKVIGLSSGAFRLCIEALCYANRLLTDGVISAAAAKHMARRPAYITELVEARLWDSLGTDYQIHDYLKYQPTRAAIESRREEVSRARAEAGRSGGIASGISKREATAKQTDSPVPNPTRISTFRSFGAVADATILEEKRVAGTTRRGA